MTRMAVPPGEHEIAFSYTIDATSGTMNIVKKVSLPTSDFVVFAESGEAKLEGLGRPEQKLIWNRWSCDGVLPKKRCYRGRGNSLHYYGIKSRFV